MIAGLLGCAKMQKIWFWFLVTSMRKPYLYQTFQRRKPLLVFLYKSNFILRVLPHEINNSYKLVLVVSIGQTPFNEWRINLWVILNRRQFMSSFISSFSMIFPTWNLRSRFCEFKEIMVCAYRMPLWTILGFDDFHTWKRLHHQAREMALVWCGTVQLVPSKARKTGDNPSKWILGKIFLWFLRKLSDLISRTKQNTIHKVSVKYKVSAGWIWFTLQKNENRWLHIKMNLWRNTSAIFRKTPRVFFTVSKSNIKVTNEMFGKILSTNPVLPSLKGWVSFRWAWLCFNINLQ